MDLPVVLARPIIVKIYVFVYVLHTIAGQLQHRKDKGLIVGSLHPSAVTVLHMFLLDLVEQTDREGTHVSEFLPDETIQLVFDFSEGVSTRVTLLEVILVQFAEEVVGIGYTGLLCLVSHIQQLENHLSQELIVTTDQHGNGLPAAVLLNGHVDVRYCSHALRVPDQNVSMFRQFRFLKENRDQVSRSIIGGIIDYDYLVVLVILVDDGLQVVLITIVLRVVVSCDHYANGQLLFVECEVILIIEAFDLLLYLFLHMSSLKRINKCSPKVEATKCPRISYLLLLKLVLLADAFKHSDLFLPHFLLRVRQQHTNNRLLLPCCLLQRINCLKLLQ